MLTSVAETDCLLGPLFESPSGAIAAPTVHDGRVYTVSKHGKVFCLDARKGGVIWSKDLEKQFGTESPRWGLAGSAVIVDGMVVLNSGTHGIALNRTDGSLVWQNGKGAAA
ncbi:MAG: PQQ-binding-like beta-propeller repeat protein [Phycisphaerales bacterium]|nr:MAG: PQQ-binding-like beta-propeller repeat protein [Phycisphaerales bacterium]